jgi:heme oxygenase (biliverdin-IX-beta and delta-forming)
MKPHILLRTATSEDHASVDTAFSAFDPASPAGYAAFLRAHARALFPVEEVLDTPDFPVPLRRRGPLLADDLAVLGQPLPEALRLPPPVGAAETFGIAYVLEGSRLGGGLIARSIPPGQPMAYLSAVHEPGEWRRFLQALDDAAGEHTDWIASAVAGARRTFALFSEAAAIEGAAFRRDRPAR